MQSFRIVNSTCGAVNNKMLSSVFSVVSVFDFVLKTTNGRYLVNSLKPV